jgi:hypothetical protein
MNWTTLYITGRFDFREELRDKLEGSRLDFMPGYIEGTAGPRIYDLFWVNEDLSLRKFKEEIGSKLIWKYRLRFHTSLEDFIQSVNKEQSSSDLTEEEKDLLSAMRQSA